MDYMVVEAYTKKLTSNTEFFVALPGWLDTQNKIVYYPRIDSKLELSNVRSTYAPDWIPRILKKVWHSSLALDHAESMVDFHVENNSGLSNEEASEPANVTTRLKKNLMSAPKSLPRAKQYSLKKSTAVPPVQLTSPPPAKIMKISEQPESPMILEELQVDEVSDEQYDNTLPVRIYENECDKESIKVFDDEYTGYFLQTTNDGTTILHPETQPPYEKKEHHEYYTDSDVLVTMTTNEYREIQNQLNKITEKIDAQAEAISKIFGVTKNIDSFITQYLKDISTTCVVENTQQIEQFDDLEAMEPFKTTKDLVDFEELLANKTFADRLIRFLKIKYNFASLKAKTLFGLVLRQLTSADLFTNYSWKGNSRKGEQNICFATKHEKFIKFITIVVRMVDLHVKVCDVEEWFSSRLRQKKQIAEREKIRTTEPNLPAPRTRLPIATAANSENVIEVSTGVDNFQGNKENEQGLAN